MRKKTPSNPLRYRLFNPGSHVIPKNAEMTIFLIIHELKLHMIYRALKPFATVDAYLEAGFTRLILKQLNLLDGKDETYNQYFELIDRWTDKFSSDPEVVLKRALKVYNTLLKIRDARRKHRSS